jgi:hypothetical protein
MAVLSLRSASDASRQTQPRVDHRVPGAARTANTVSPAGRESVGPCSHVRTSISTPGGEPPEHAEHEAQNVVHDKVIRAQLNEAASGSTAARSEPADRGRPRRLDPWDRDPPVDRHRSARVRSRAASIGTAISIAAGAVAANPRQRSQTVVEDCRFREVRRWFHAAPLAITEGDFAADVAASLLGALSGERRSAIGSDEDEAGRRLRRLACARAVG